MKNWIFYVMEASDEEFDTEEVRKLVKRLDELDPIPLPWKSDEEALKDFWDCLLYTSDRSVRR